MPGPYDPSPTTPGMLQRQPEITRPPRSPQPPSATSKTRVSALKVSAVMGGGVWAVAVPMIESVDPEGDSSR